MMTSSFTFIASKEIDAKRILDQLSSIENHFFIKHNFYPVDKEFLGNKQSVVFPTFLPDIYSKLNKPQEDLYYLDTNYAKKFNKSLDLISKNLDKEWLLVPDELRKQKELEWSLQHYRFIDCIQEMFGLTYSHLDLQIYVSSYCTSSSFLMEILDKKSIKIHVFLRKDMPISEIADGVISALFQKDADEMHFDWDEREAVFDFLMQKTKIANMFTIEQGTLESTKNLEVNVQLMQQSAAFLSKLHYKYIEPLRIIEQDIFINGDVSTWHFTPTETKILQLLLQKKGKICSYFDIGNVIWDDPNEFSIWAISQMIYKIRHKLQKNGLSADMLKTYRGKGFQLTND